MRVLLASREKQKMRGNTYKYRHYNHSVGLSVVHLVWIPKRRKPVLVGAIRDRLFQIIYEVATERGWNVRAIEIAPDHVHLFIEISPTDAVNQVIKAIKGRSAYLLRNEFAELKKLPSLWTNSYFFSTAGNVSADTIEWYIKDPHHK
jgi:putative transposase